MRAAALLLAAALLPSPSLAATPATETEHVVAEGETLNGVANRAGVASKAIAQANDLKAPYALRTGQRLKIPRSTSTKAAVVKPQVAKSQPTKPRPTSAATQQESVHLVAEGETLGGIANRAKVPRILIAEANGLAPPYDVRPGQKLLIPRTRHYTVKPGDTGFAIAYKHAVPWSQIAVANGIEAAAPVTPGKTLLIPTVLEAPAAANAQSAQAAVKSAAAASAVASAAVAAASAPTGRSGARFVWPLEGTVRRRWKPRTAADHHDGLDIAAPHGTAVRAAASGTVLYAENEKEQFGNLVVVDHGGGLNTAYGFLSRITVKKGAKVAAGERLGLVGNTGRARSDELHFEVRQNGVPVDPEPELTKAP